MTARTEIDGQNDILNVNGMEVVIDGRVILRDVDFRVEAGEFTGLIGANGSGKTTLFRVILGLQPTVAGTVSFHGEPLARRTRSIGYVPQKVLFDPDMPLRARDLVALGVDGHRYGLRRRSRAVLNDIEEMLRAVDAEQFADRRIGELSGGEQQRVLIAHALISRPGCCCWTNHSRTSIRGARRRSFHCCTASRPLIAWRCCCRRTR